MSTQPAAGATDSPSSALSGQGEAQLLRPVPSSQTLDIRKRFDDELESILSDQGGVLEDIIRAARGEIDSAVLSRDDCSTVLSYIDSLASSRASSSGSVTPFSSLFPVTEDINGTVLPAVIDEKALNALCCDGGGIRAYSSLVVLEDLMKRIGRPDSPPAEVFTMMGGVSGGGLVVAMLGILRMTVAEGKAIFERVSKRVFGGPVWFKVMRLAVTRFRNRLSAKNLENVITGILEKALMNANAPMSHPNGDVHVFFVATDASTPNIPRSVIFRNKPAAEQPASDCTIVEALRATTAAPTYFKPKLINGMKFADGGCGFNNPTELLIEEAEALWPGRELNCIVSIGTGKPATCSGILAMLIGCVTNSNMVHERVSKLYANKGIYYRFDCDDGIGTRVGLSEYKKLRHLAVTTKAYLEREDTSRDLDACAAKLTRSLWPQLKTE